MPTRNLLNFGGKFRVLRSSSEYRTITLLNSTLSRPPPPPEIDAAEGESHRNVKQAGKEERKEGRKEGNIFLLLSSSLSRPFFIITAITLQPYRAATVNDEKHPNPRVRPSYSLAKTNGSRPPFPPSSLLHSHASDSDGGGDELSDFS